MPGQITQYVLKVHSRCDLACDHCYVYEHADQSWRVKPHTMVSATAERTAARIAEHADGHGLARVRIILHGGEPLLLGKERMRELLETLEAGITPVTGVDMRIHTNGMLLDTEWCALFRHYGVRIGVSLDGDKAATDRHRRYADGRSSHPQARRALAMLRTPAFRDLYAGILCTIDLNNDPIAVYEALIAEEPPNLDLLLPHATWESPPLQPGAVSEPYAAWLGRVYRRWVSDGRPVPIRFFDSLISAAAGGPSTSEAVGLDPVDLVVVDTDGSWEQPDSLKTAFDGAPATGLSVFSSSVDELAAQPGFVTRQGGLAALCAICRDCSVVRICGGGLYAHRYRAGTGFDNPTVYCSDMKALIATVGSGRPALTDQSLARHSLPEGSFDALATGPGTVPAIRALAEVRLSLTRALLVAIARADDRWQDNELRLAANEGWAVLCALDRQHPEAVRAVLGHPYAHAWALRCLRPTAESDRDLDRAHIAGFAVAAVLRAGLSAQLRVPVRAGKLHVPTIGTMRVTAEGARTATVTIAAGRLAVAGHLGTWLRVRRVTGSLLNVDIEDLDPFRDCQAWRASGRRSAAQWRRWQSGLTEAAAILAAEVPSYARVIGAGLRAVVPLRPASTGDRGATARQAFGATALALPRRPDGLAALLLHEFQHAKLHALTDLHDLFDADNPRRLSVPWRDDPRPVEGVLHGAYAHLALTHLSLSRGPLARERYQLHRGWVCRAVDDLAASQALTSDGDRFVAGMYAAATANLGDERG
jgi:uncharacterized protein